MRRAPELGLGLVGEEIGGWRGSAGGAKLRFAVEDGKGSGDMVWVETV
jgi:hypothetical protein